MKRETRRRHCGWPARRALFAEGHRDLLRVFQKRCRDCHPLKRRFRSLLGPSLRGVAPDLRESGFSGRVILGRLEEVLQALPGILLAGEVTLFVDSLLESLLLLKDALLREDDKDPLGNPGKDGPQFDPAVSGKSRIRHDPLLRIPGMETGSDLFSQAAHEAHGLGRPGQPMDAGGELGQVGRRIEGAVHDETVGFIALLD